MNPFDKALSKIGLMRRSEAAAFFTERGNDGTVWTRIGGNNVQFDRDITPAFLAEARTRAFRAWRLNPFVFRIVSMWVNYVVGNNLTFVAQDDRVSKVLDNFVNDPANRLRGQRLRKRGQEYKLFGELIPMPVVNQLTGRTWLRWIDPAIVDKVELDPMTHDEPMWVCVRTDTGQPKKLRIIHDYTSLEQLPEMYASLTPDRRARITGRKIGDVFFLGANMVIGATRGTTDLLPSLDWCGSTEDTLFTMQERTRIQSRVVEVLTVTGATPEELNQYREPTLPDGKPNPKYIPPAKSGSRVLINEKMKMEFVAPNLAAGDMETAMRMFKSMIEIGTGTPEHFFGQGGDVNRATAAEMGSPFFNMLEAGQQEMKDFWHDIGEFVIDQKIIFSNELEGVTDTSFEVQAPEISQKDQQALANTAKTWTDILVAAKASGIIDQQQLNDLIVQVIGQAGLEIKPTIAPVPDAAPAPAFSVN